MFRLKGQWAAAIFLLLAIVHTWPLVTGLDRLSRTNDDQWLNAWAISWIAHQLPRDPVHLFDANIYYPHEGTFGYTEPLIVPGLMGAPLRWLGASALLTYNVLLLAGFTLTGLAMYALVKRWTGDPWSGLLAGALLAFSTPLLTRLPHLQVLHLYALPLSVLVLDRLLAQRRTLDAVSVGVVVLLAGLTSGYLVVFVVFALGSALVARMPIWLNREGVGMVVRLGVVGLVTLSALVVVLEPYTALDLRRAPPSGPTNLGQALESYLSSAANLHYHAWSQAFYERAPGTLFPGVVAGLLAAVGLTRRATAPRGVRPMLVSIALTGLVLSLGPLTPAYTWASEIVPPLQSLRAPSRFGLLVLFSIAALAGIGLTAFRQRGTSTWRALGPVAALALVTVESLHAPIPYRPIQWGAAPIYRALEATEPGATVELPIYFGDTFHRNARYLLASTTHWRPLVNGFGGFRPPNYDQLAEVIATWPSVAAIGRLHSLGVKHVVVHTARYRDPEDIRRTLDRAEEGPDLTLVARAGPDRLYRLSDEPQTDVGRWVYGLPWSELTLVDGPRSGSALRQTQGVGRAFALQGTHRFIAFFEDTTDASRISLRLPVAMTGHFLDGLTGASLGDIRVEAPESSAPPTVVRIPAGRRSVVLQLQAGG